MPFASVTPSTSQEIDTAIEHVGCNAQTFSLLTPQEKSRLLDACIRRIVEIAPKWVDIACAAKHIKLGTARSAEEWLAGPVVTVRQARLLLESLQQIAATGVPRSGANFRTLANGKIDVDVFPASSCDKLMLAGFSAAVRFPAIMRDAQSIMGFQASQHRLQTQRRRQKVCAVLGAGNVSSIAPTDVFSKMFIEGYVCVLKMNPVNEWLGPILENALKPLIARDFLAIVYGGAEQGDYLCQHAGIG